MSTATSIHHRSALCRCPQCLEQRLESSPASRLDYYQQILLWAQAVIALTEATSAPSTLMPTALPPDLWRANLRYLWTPTEWGYVRTALLDHVGNRCEVCGATAGPRENLECHEAFDWDAGGGTARLDRVLVLCQMCHLTQHVGMTGIRGEEPQVHAHLRRINGWTARQASRAIDQARAAWLETQDVDWDVDFGAIRFHTDAERLQAAQRRAETKKRERRRALAREMDRDRDRRLGS